MEDFPADIDTLEEDGFDTEPIKEPNGSSDSGFNVVPPIDFIDATEAVPAVLPIEWLKEEKLPVASILGLLAEEVDLLVLGSESERPVIEKELFGGVDFRGMFWEGRPCLMADPTRSLKRLGLLLGMPTWDEAAGAGTVEDQLRPKMSPIMDGGGLGRPDPAEDADWCVQDGFVAGDVLQDEAADEGAVDLEEEEKRGLEDAAFELSFWSFRGRADEELRDSMPKSNW
ncbi:hypothetical protein HPP92_002154 [Vanilla planifolia]|uniref:Uncharacterized protein n=1 Tax=Vanilla planifolia TaxID=51239 RepID=A0A835S4X7_VANPL|nr:hypothetical protein HPP92_002154 [Vanilla planifolia]